MRRDRGGLVLQSVIAAVLLVVVGVTSAQLSSQRDANAALQRQLQAAHVETLSKIDAILVYDAATRRLLTSYADPQGAYRVAIDALLCAELRDVRALAAHAGIPLVPLLTPAEARTYTIVGGGCRVAVLP